MVVDSTEGQTAVDDVWVEQWRAALRTLLSPDGHEVGGPATAQELAGLADLHGAALPPDLLTFHRLVAEVRLPDVGNGWWIHRPPVPGEDPGHPRVLSDGRAVVVFGSDGGGALFALSAGSGVPVLRLAGGALVGETYDADCATVMAVDLRDFLGKVLGAVSDPE